MKTIFLTFFLLTQLWSDQNRSTVLGAQKSCEDTSKVYKQKDGSTFSGIPRGETYFKYIELKNGYIVLYNKESEQYEYAHIKNGILLPSGLPVRSENTPENIVKIPQETLKQLQTDAYKKHF